MRAIRVRNLGTPWNHGFMVKETNPYYEWCKNNEHFKCREFEL